MVASKRANGSQEEEKQKLEQIIRKLGHFRTRYTEHYKAIGFAQKKKVEIQNQVNEFLTNFQTNYTLRDL